MKTKNLFQWLPGIICVVLSVVFCIIYAVTDGSKATMYFQLLVAAVFPFLFPVYGLISGKKLPVLLSVTAAVFVFLACNLGSALGFYDRFYCWDLIMHGIFGFICSFMIFALLIRWNGSKLNPAGFMVIIFVFTMGIAALWEVWEYLTDLITAGDAQRVAESIALGKSPVADTMEDIMIAMAGSAVFFITLVIDKLTRFKIYGRLCGFAGFTKESGK